MNGGHGKRLAYIFDIDRTLADIRNLEHLFAPGLETDEWRVFHEASINAPVFPAVLHELNLARENDYATIAVTARPEMYRDITYDWFRKRGIHMDDAYFRPTGLEAPDESVKYDLFVNEISRYYHPVHAFDDKQSVLDMWAHLGIPGTLVRGGEYYNPPVDHEGRVATFLRAMSSLWTKPVPAKYQSNVIHRADSALYMAQA